MDEDGTSRLVIGRSFIDVCRRKSREGRMMANTCTAFFERDGDWYIAHCPEVPGANGQGRTKDEVRSS